MTGLLFVGGRTWRPFARAAQAQSIAVYRQYVADLLRLAVYVRQIVTRPVLRDHLAQQRPADLEFFDSVLAESEGKAAG